MKLKHNKIEEDLGVDFTITLQYSNNKTQIIELKKDGNKIQLDE